ncbi:MAG: hypothetical protein JSV68_05615, partial [Anaerolineaceae bacterium]
VSESELLEIGHEDFHAFLATHPQYSRALLNLLTARLRDTVRLFPDLGGFNVGATVQGDADGRAAYPVTLVGYGRYGSLHIGPKYAKDGYPWDMQAIVDPALNRARLQSSVLGHKRPDIPIFGGFEAWYERCFQPLDDDQRQRQVVEIALRPDLDYAQSMLYIEAGVKQLILPKPVVMVRKELDLLTEAVAEYEVKTAVSSQWHYSDFPKLIRREIGRMAKQGSDPYPTLHKVEIEFSKENGAAISTTPPLSELPHVLQLLESFNLLDLDSEAPEVSGDAMMVDVSYWPGHISGGVHLRAGLDWQPAPEIKRRYPNWDVQERSLKVTFADDTTRPGLEIDFWIKFARSGDLAIRPGRIMVRASDGSGRSRPLTMQFVEDQLLNMNEQIFASFEQDFQAFQDDLRVLSLERYGPIGRQLMLIEEEWRTGNS